MARNILTTVVVVFLLALTGCHGVDAGRSQILPSYAKQPPSAVASVDIISASEADIIEQVAIHRQAYRQGLQLLVEHYNKIGDNMRLNWAKNELQALDKTPQYNYIIEASIAGPKLKASTSITEADYMYREAARLEKEAGGLVIVKNEDLLRTALDYYNQLIRKHPSSDKIDDAAFRAAGILEHFKDYTLALLYYKRAYQWDPRTIHPARFKAAYILDRHLHRRLEALELYQQSIAKEQLLPKYKEFAQGRVKDLTSGVRTSETSK
ncbi:MAG: hypothetical protein JXB29_12145 [Sedimentisphaerales bacterium]|nr:hypothetical protein [Sedimentisphaerales bacterium]